MRSLTVQRLRRQVRPGWLIALCATCVACSDRSPDKSSPGPLDATVESAVCQDATLYVDQDGDGLGGEKTATVPACPGQLPAGYSSKTGDCDDLNPATFQYAYPDADEDGVGADNGAICVGASIPTGFVTRPPGDCDDEDPRVYPGAPEQWFDGIDSNCDQADDPTDCAAKPAACGCAEAFGPPPTITPDPSCLNLADLFFVQVFRCHECGRPEIMYATVGNRGSKVGPPNVKIRLWASGKTTLDTVIETPLAPGEATVPLMLDAVPGKGELKIEISDKDDCNLNNNQQSLLIARVDCR